MADDKKTIDPRGRSRGKHIKVKNARGKSTSQVRWLERQLNDPYVAEANRLGYKSRAAFKLIWLDDKYKILKGAKRIVDLGCAPGGWLQIAEQRTPKGTQILGIDIRDMEPVQGTEFIMMDFMADDAEQRLFDALGGPVDCVISDMANSATGHKQTDHLRTMALIETGLDFALKVLVPGGSYTAKVLRGGTEGELLKILKTNFKTVKHGKPDSSRKESTELYVIAQGFKGRKDG